MYGTSYSGFNSLHMAAEQPPALKGVIAIYATDDRYTDDVHLCGGWPGLDIIDYCHYMTPMNALPPVPALWGEGWRDEWSARISEHEPWLFPWLEHTRRDEYWEHGSIRPELQRYRLSGPHRRRVGRRLPQQHVPHRRGIARGGTARRTPGRTMAARGDVVVPAWPAYRPGARDGRVVGSLAAWPRSRGRSAARALVREGFAYGPHPTSTRCPECGEQMSGRRHAPATRRGRCRRSRRTTWSPISGSPRGCRVPGTCRGVSPMTNAPMTSGRSPGTGHSPTAWRSPGIPLSGCGFRSTHQSPASPSGCVTWHPTARRHWCRAAS